MRSPEIQYCNLLLVVHQNEAFCKMFSRYFAAQNQTIQLDMY